MRRQIRRASIAILALVLLTPLALNRPLPLVMAQQPPIDSWMRKVERQDSIRVKGWNLAGSGPEDFQCKLVVKFRRASDPSREVTSSNIITADNDANAQGIASGSSGSWAFGASAGKSKTYTGVTELATSKTIDQTTVANTTVVRTTAVHGLSTGDVVTITGNTSTPVINGKWMVTVTDTTHFSIPIKVTVDGANGTMVSSHLSITGGDFVAGDVGKRASCSNCGVTCTTDSPCQGPKFPRGTNWQGMITAVISTTEIRVKPIITATPSAASVFIREPVLVADEDGLELGDGWLTGVDLNFWQTGPKPGQSEFEVELNRKAFNDHEGVSLIPKNYLETSGHLAWPWGRSGYDSAMGHGWTHQQNGGNLNGGNPAAGVELSYVVPANVHWKNIYCSFVLTATGAANRFVVVLVDDNVANVSYRFPAPTVQTDAQVDVYNFGSGLTRGSVTPGAGTITTYQNIDMPIGLELTEGWRIRTATVGIQAADQFSAFSCTGNTVIVE